MDRRGPHRHDLRRRRSLPGETRRARRRGRRPVEASALSLAFPCLPRLVEKGDLAAATSSASSKLIHGGLRYLEHGAFRLVREALAEREVLLTSAPHIIHPLPFVLPYAQGLRPRALLRLGLFLYDQLGGRRYPSQHPDCGFACASLWWASASASHYGFRLLGLPSGRCQAGRPQCARRCGAWGEDFDPYRDALGAAHGRSLAHCYRERQRDDGSGSAHSYQCGGAVTVVSSFDE